MSTEVAKSNEQVESDQEIRDRACPKCYLCGTSGESLYQGLTDRLHAAPGHWNFKRCPNTECGLIWLDPIPLEADIGKAYKKYFTHRVSVAASNSRISFLRRTVVLFESAYLAHRFNCGEHAGKRFQWLFALPIILSRIECDELNIPLRYLSIRRKGRVLDVGCGDASVVKLAQSLGWNAEGVDFDPQAIEAARRRGLNAHLGKLEDFNYPENSFDLVLMSNVIEHVHDPLHTLTEINRILRPGGTLVVTTPNTSSWGHRHFGSNWVHLDPPRHLKLFNGTNLRRLTQRVGLSAQVSSSLRLTPLTFVASRAIRNTGRGYALRWSGLVTELYGRAGSIVELLMRAWDPFAADELLLEAQKSASAERA